MIDCHLLYIDILFSLILKLIRYCNLPPSVEVKIGTDLVLKIANTTTVLQSEIMGYFKVFNQTQNRIY